jgi:SAM-dependent methyltransferase
MAFYADFAGHYDDIFPCRPAVTAFLQDRLPADGRVLDIGCGTGGHAGALAAAGRDVLGVDLDPGMIAEAERRHPAATFRLMGMDDIGRLEAGAFGGVYCVGNVLPHLPAARLAPFVAAVARLLRSGGVWIFQTVNFDRLLDGDRHVFPEIRVADAGLVFHREYVDIAPDRLLFRTRLIGPQGEIFQGETELHPRASAEYSALHRAGPWREEGHFADWSGRGFALEEAAGSVFVWRRV